MVELDGVCLPLLVDTAASKSLLSESTVRWLFLSTVDHGRHRGAVQIQPHQDWHGRHLHLLQPPANLLGFDLFCTLGFSITDNTGTSILMVTTPWQHRWPSLFAGLGCLSTFNHQPLIDPAVSPVIQPLRCLPLCLHDDVMAKLQKLLDAHIIEQVDLRQTNKAVIPDKYSLPMMEELSAKFHGSTVFSKLELRQIYLQQKGYINIQMASPLPWPSTPWTHIQVNICGELHGVLQHQCLLLVAYDLHWPEVLPTSSVTTRVVSDFLSSLFARWGVPDAITTDNRPQFISADFIAFMGGRGIKHIRTALYHPQANGGVERFNQTLKNGLRAHLADGLPFSPALQITLLH
ncbi:hypothetical protein L3Q82_014555 [Scortum barcoo]|uniref:Uncharacterized protein n=1 Tax=Scortum barcoo TaxID=214431 RepID=A0ACB8VWZ7_9TELE|nr:hypothetical protein L3Q82_014555 [Scortum barcoo]